MASVTDVLMGAAVEISLAAIVLGVVYRVLGSPLGVFKLNKIQPFQRGVLMKGEVVDRVLEPGTHWIWSRRTIFLCDTRPKAFQLNLQDVRCADGLWIRVSLRGVTRVVDAVRYVTASADSLSTLYVELRRLINEAVQMQATPLRLEDTAALTASLRELLDNEASRLGMTVVSLDVWELIPLYSQQTEEDEIQQLPVQ
jgi:hypothetical protein